MTVTISDERSIPLQRAPGADNNPFVRNLDGTQLPLKGAMLNGR